MHCIGSGCDYAVWLGRRFALVSFSGSDVSWRPAASTRISSNTVYSANKEMGSNDKNFSNTGYEPKDYYLMETYVESLTESLTQPQFSEQRFLEEVDYDDTALEEMFHNAHRVHVYHSQREDLSVGQSSNGETRCGENRETCCGK